MTSPTLTSALCQVWSERASAVALVSDGQAVTFAEMARRAEDLAQRYRRLGLKPGDRVLCRLPNHAETMIALAATWLCEGIHVGIDSSATATEVSRVADQLTPKMVLSVEDHGPGRQDAAGRIAVRTYDAPHGTGGHAQWSGPAADAPAVIFLSSGSVGQAKFALGFQGNLATRWLRLAQWLTFSPADVHLAHLPLSHGFGLMMSLSALLSGGRLVLLEGFSAAGALRAVERERVTVLNGTPAHYRLVLRELATRQYCLDSLRTGVSSGAAISPGLAADIMTKLNMKLVSMYGSSEGVGVATSDEDEIRLGSVGRPEPGSVRIVDRSHRPVSAGCVGEIAFARKAFPVRYWQPLRTGADAARPSAGWPAPLGWYFSRDLGHLDDAGRLYVHGRLDRQIDRGGLLIDPEEVEDALLSCSGVRDAVVFGMPDAVLGQRVCAAVVLAEGTREDEVLHQVRGSLSQAKAPQRLYRLESIPRTKLGKPNLRQLRTVIAEMTSSPLPGADRVSSSPRPPYQPPVRP